MKLVLISFLTYIIFVCFPIKGEEYLSNYNISVSGLKIGGLEWRLVIENEKYQNNLTLQSKGFLSSIYKFEGEYFSNGVFKNNTVKSEKYTHNWKTKKINKKMNLSFDNNKIISIKQSPLEKEVLRINAFNLNGVNDPLSSFLQILMGSKSAVVVDGRRTYTMEVIEDFEIISIKLINYSNLWADHKRRT